MAFHPQTNCSPNPVELQGPGRASANAGRRARANARALPALPALPAARPNLLGDLLDFVLGLFL